MVQRLNRTEPSTKILHRLREAGLCSTRTGQGHGPDEGALIRDNQGVPVIGLFLYRLATIADDLRNNWHVSLLTIDENFLYDSTTMPSKSVQATPARGRAHAHRYNVDLR